MPFNEEDQKIQDALMRLGYRLPKWGADGHFGPETRAAAEKWIANGGGFAPKADTTGDDIPNLTRAARNGMRFITMHWDVGDNTFRPGEAADEHYHYVVDGAGVVHACQHKPEDNINISGDYAAHVRRANTRNIGIACLGMRGAQVDWTTGKMITAGPSPLTEVQVEAMVSFVARLAMACNITPSRQTILTHAEWHPTHGVWQRGKWDIRWLPGMSVVGGALDIGDKLRRRIMEKMK